jgi:nicotinate-nucleotide pyrophosphorylase (carboxylating)
MSKSLQLAKYQIKEFLKEDIGFFDITSQTLIPNDQKARAVIYLQEMGIASGLEEAKLTFEILDCDVNQLVNDGSEVSPRQILLKIDGPAISILSGERTALNLIGRMSGIATLTANIIKKAHEVNSNLRIAATRKTVPGLRNLDKKAVEHGGGDTHRFRLDDCILIKDNHLQLVSSISEAIKRVKSKVSFTKKIEVEVKNYEEAEEAARAGADIIMFDNISPIEMKDYMKKLDGLNLREGILFEASGGITPNNIAEYSSSNVDILSLGYLTHSVRSLKVKLQIKMV